MNKVRANGATEDLIREPAQTIPAFSMRGSLSPLLLIPCLAISAIALLAPNDVLDVHPALKRFADFMVQRIPHMLGHADSTRFPQLALLVNCLVVACTAWIAAVVLVQTHLNYPKLLALRRFQGPLEIKQHVMIFLGMFVMLGALAVMVLVAGDVSWIKGATTERRGFFYVFSAGFMPYITGSLVGGQILNVRLFMDTFMERK